MKLFHLFLTLIEFAASITNNFNITFTMARGKLHRNFREEASLIVSVTQRPALLHNSVIFSYSKICAIRKRRNQSALACLPVHSHGQPNNQALSDRFSFYLTLKLLKFEFKMIGLGHIGQNEYSFSTRCKLTFK